MKVFGRCTIKDWCKGKNDCKTCNKSKRTRRHMDAGLRDLVESYKDTRPDTDNGKVDGERVGGTVGAAIELRDQIRKVIKKNDLFQCRVWGMYDYLDCRQLYYFKMDSSVANDGEYYPDANKPKEYKCCALKQGLMIKNWRCERDKCDHIELKKEENRLRKY